MKALNVCNPIEDIIFGGIGKREEALLEIMCEESRYEKEKIIIGKNDEERTRLYLI